MNETIAQRFDPAPAMRPAAAPIGPILAEIAHPSPYWCELTVTEQELSPTIEHVSNVRYIAWLDRAAELHADSLGFTRRALLAENVMWFVARHEVDYLAEAWLGDRLLIATWLREARRVRAWRETVVMRAGDARIICQAATLWVLVDLNSRRPCRIPTAMVRGFVPLTVVDQLDQPMVSSCTSP